MNTIYHRLRRFAPIFLGNLNKGVEWVFGGIFLIFLVFVIGGAIIVVVPAVWRFLGGWNGTAPLLAALCALTLVTIAVTAGISLHEYRKQYKNKGD
jgi:hypothetical protein